MINWYVFLLVVFERFPLLKQFSINAISLRKSQDFAAFLTIVLFKAEKKQLINFCLLFFDFLMADFFI